MNKRQIIIRVLSYIAVVLSILLILYISGIRVSDLSPDTILSIAHNNTILVLIIMLIIMMLQNIFTFIPLVLVITLNITLFGFWKGYLYSGFCSVIGSTILFLSIRYLFSNLFSTKNLQKYQQKIEKNGFLFVMTSRMFPFIPTNMINIVSGLSSIKISHFIYGTTIGNFAYGFILSSVSYGVISASNHNSLILIIIIPLIILAVLLSRFFIKKRQEPKTS